MPAILTGFPSSKVGENFEAHAAFCLQTVGLAGDQLEFPKHRDQYRGQDPEDDV